MKVHKSKKWSVMLLFICCVFHNWKSFCIMIKAHICGEKEKKCTYIQNAAKCKQVERGQKKCFMYKEAIYVSSNWLFVRSVTKFLIHHSVPSSLSAALKLLIFPINLY